jgi:hypothetical protein
MMSLDMQIKSLQDTLADMRNDFQEKLGLMFQVEAQTKKAEIRSINQGRKEANIKVTRVPDISERSSGHSREHKRNRNRCSGGT